MYQIQEVPKNRPNRLRAVTIFCDRLRWITGLSIFYFARALHPVQFFLLCTDNFNEFIITRRLLKS